MSRGKCTPLIAQWLCCNALSAAMMPKLHLCPFVERNHTTSSFILCSSRLKIENGDYSSIASLSKGEELHEKIRPGNLSGDLQKQVSADELKALQEIGFEAGSTRHIISHGDQR